MPYRRLPNTDKARLRAMQKAHDIAQNTSFVDIAFSNETYQKLKIFLPIFEQALKTQNEAYKNQIKNSAKYRDSLKKIKLYISHFIQVMNFAILRNELKPSIRTFYDIEITDNRVPTLNTENEVIYWGKKIIKGEEERIKKGGFPIMNPKIALVKVRYEKFIEAYNFQKTLKDVNMRALNKISKYRKEADEIILSIWNEVEDNFQDLSQVHRREKCIEYGLVYVYRRNEKNKELKTSVFA